MNPLEPKSLTMSTRIFYRTDLSKDPKTITVYIHLLLEGLHQNPIKIDTQLFSFKCGIDYRALQHRLKLLETLDFIKLEQIRNCTTITICK